MPRKELFPDELPPISNQSVLTPLRFRVLNHNGVPTQLYGHPGVTVEGYLEASYTDFSSPNDYNVIFRLRFDSTSEKYGVIHHTVEEPGTEKEILGGILPLRQGFRLSNQKMYKRVAVNWANKAFSEHIRGKKKYTGDVDNLREKDRLPFEMDRLDFDDDEAKQIYDEVYKPQAATHGVAGPYVNHSILIDH